LQIIEATLQHLKAHLEGRVRAPVETQVQTHMDACILSIQELQAALEKVKKVQVSEWEFDDKWRWLYPFRATTLVKLRTIIDELSGDPVFAMQVLQM
jgi:hypothetical protein